MATSTSNVITTKSGTGFTVDVTAANLDLDINTKDFFILHNGTPYTQLTDYTKTSATVLTYTGAALGATTIEVRRKTSYDVIRTVNFGERMSSALWNNELEKKSRWQAEADLNGVGAAFSGTLPTPKNDAFGVVWSNDTFFPPSRNSLYNYLVTLAPLASPTFTGTPKSVTPAIADNTTNIATTAYVKSNLANYAALASPTFSGTPSVPTPLTADNGVTIANTAYVKNNLANYATTASLSAYALVASPSFTGTPTAPTAAIATNTTQLATTAFVKSNVNVGSNTVVIAGILRVSWGSTSLTTNASGDGAVTFGTAFSVTPQTVIAMNGDASVGQDLIVGIVTTSSTGFTFRVQRGNNLAFASSAFRVNWLAFGAP